MSALLETTSLPGVYSLAETGTHRQSEIESCQRLAHEVAVIMVGSTGPASRPQNDLHGKAFDQRVHDGPSERPRGYGGLRDRRGATGISGDVASQSDLDRVYESRHRAENRRRLREMQALLNWCRSVCVY
jgi:hypothetical protein